VDLLVCFVELEEVDVLFIENVIKVLLVYVVDIKNVAIRLIEELDVDSKVSSLKDKEDLLESVID